MRTPIDSSNSGTAATFSGTRDRRSAPGGRGRKPASSTNGKKESKELIDFRVSHDFSTALVRAGEERDERNAWSSHLVS
jgi:hypothetical protein